MTFDTEDLQRHIPYYLTSEDQNTLLNELKAISEGSKGRYLLSKFNDHFQNEMLQGDGWKGFQLFSFDRRTQHTVRGIVLSNSCDIDPTNRRGVPRRRVFAPLVRLSKYENLLLKSIDRRRVDDKLASIRAQKTTNIFYLPARESLEDDYIARLDDVHSMPLSDLSESECGKKLFTLNNTGFYMFIFKISIHFCRLQENINRQGSTNSML